MYAVGVSHSGSSRTGGDSVRMCGFSRPTMCGMQACETVYVPRTWIPFIRSNRLSGTSVIEPRLIAEALFTHMSMPPNCSTVCATADATDCSSRMSPTIGRACPPASSSSLAAVYTVPGSLGCGSAVFAISAMLAPSAAARVAIANPMPRLAPEMNMVFPDREDADVCAMGLPYAARMSAVTALVSRIRSCGWTTTSQPRLPALHSTRSQCSAEASTTVGSGLR